MKERIRKVMEQTRMSQQDFANRLGISPASLSSIFTGRTNPTNNHVIAIHKAFPDININWLMFGEGEMYENAAEESELVDSDHMEGITESASGTALPGGQVANGQYPKNVVGGGTNPSLFAQESMMESNAVHPSYGGRGRSLRSESQAYGSVDYPSVQTVMNIDKKVPKIKEIRVFFDDGTYQTFAPSTKS